ncbi:MAG: YfhO family protein [Acutalibacteraceae bacterium]
MSTVALEKKAKRNLRPRRTFYQFLLDNIFVLLAFIIPFILMLVSFAIKKCSPFGDQQILVTDLWHQYYPFLVEFQDKLQSGSSLLFDFTSGMGTNYLALMSYYLSSPINFLSVFVPKDWLTEFLMFSVCIDIGCAGGFCAIFLKKTYKINDLSVFFFGICYSFCAFFMGYYWNVIWLNSVAILPLVALGAVSLWRDKKFTLYVISLALSVLSNYYMGLFACIFVALTFIGYSIVQWEGVKDFFTRLGRTALFSLIGLMITALLTLPAFLALSKTYSMNNTFPSYWTVYHKWLEELSQMLALVPPSTKEGLPNLYSGIVSLALGIVYFTNKKIKIREKIFNLCLLALIFASCNVNVLDFIWHGFHYTNMIPFRFTFLFSFVLIGMGFRAYQLLDHIKIWDLLIGVFATAIIIVACVEFKETRPIVATSIIAGLIFVALILHSFNLINRKIMNLALSIVVVAEMACTAYIGVSTVTTTGTADYPRGEQNSADVIEEMKNLEADTVDLWRAEVTSTQTLNDAPLNGYNGVSVFSSMTNVKTTKFLEDLGCPAWQSGNRYTYLESSPVTNLLLNLKYLIARNGYYAQNKYINEVYSSGSVKLLKNNSYLPMGYMMNSAILTYQTEDTVSNPFSKQNEFMQKATGITDDLYTSIDVIDQGHTDYTVFPVNKTDYGLYSFSSNDQTTVPHLKFNYEVPKDGIICAYMEVTDGENVSVLKNNTNVTTLYVKRPYIMNLGTYEKGDRISLYMDLKAGASGSAKVYVAQLNEEVYDKCYNELSKNIMTATKVADTKIEGKINSTKDGILYTSIPDDTGWTVKVDGEKVDVTPIGDCMVAFNVSKGEHSIKMTYCPPGFVLGLIVTIIGIGLLVFFAIGQRKGWYSKASALLRDRFPGRKSENNIDEETSSDIVE